MRQKEGNFRKPIQIQFYSGPTEGVGVPGGTAASAVDKSDERVFYNQRSHIKEHLDFRKCTYFMWWVRVQIS